MKFLRVLIISLTMVLLLTAGSGPASVIYVPHDKVAATMIKGGPILNEPGLKVLANRRGAAEPEMHERTNHLFIVVEGEATLVVGGTLVNAKQTSAGQWHASSIKGGQTYHLTKGDVIAIPAKTPHWWKEIPTQTIAYYAINMENQ